MVHEFRRALFPALVLFFYGISPSIVPVCRMI